MREKNMSLDGAYFTIYFVPREVSLAICPLGQDSLTSKKTMAMVILLMEQIKSQIVPQRDTGTCLWGCLSMLAA